MTIEELKNNYEYKVTVRALKHEFPFIKEVGIKNPEDMDRYMSYIFLDADIDPFVMFQTYNLRPDPILMRYLKRGEPYWSTYLSMFAKEGFDGTRPIINAIEELIEGIHNSPAIPKEFKLDKKLGISGWYADPSTLPDSMTY